MAVYQALLLNTVVPQIQAAQAGDSYVMVVNATTPALRITQTGTGNAILVEDSSNPDSSPFVVTAAGDVGIGTSSPTAVSGGTVLEVSNATGSEVFVTRADTTLTAGDFIGGFGFKNTDADGTPPHYAGFKAFASSTENGAMDLHFYSARAGYESNAASMVLDSSGNLGLGVTPSAWSSLQKAIQVSATGALTSNGTSFTAVGHNYFFDGTNNKYLVSSQQASILFQEQGAFKFFTAGTGTAGGNISFTQAMTLDASGNLGLAETSPSTFGRMALRGASGSPPVAYFSVLSDTTVYGAGFESSAYIGHYRTDQSNNGQTVGYRLKTVATDATNASFLIEAASRATGSSSPPNVFSERVRINGGGYFKASNAGTYNGSTGAYHELWGDTSSGTLAYFTQASATSPNGVVIQYTAAAPNGTANTFLYCQDNAAVRATIRSNGGIANYQSNNVDLSDARTKKDIAPAPSYWSKIGALEIVTYKYNDQTHDDVNVGVIAQQVEQIEPVWVDADGFGEMPEDGVPLKTVYTKDITFAAIKALQEAMARIETLEAKIAALEAK